MLLYTLILSLFVQTFTIPLETTPAQVNLTGYWTGTTTQNDGGYSSSYDIQLYLEDKDGEITGTSVLNVGDIYAKIEVEGKFVDGLSLILKDTSIKESKIDDELDMEWCMKNYILLLKKKDEVWFLEGHWHGKTTFSNCTPGQVFLKKGVSRV